MSDFSSYYQKGDTIQFEREGVTKTETLTLKVSTVYPKTLIATENRGMSYCIGWEDRERVLLLSRGDEE